MDNYRIEETREFNDFWRYEFTYETRDRETAEKIKAFFKELLREKYGTAD